MLLVPSFLAIERQAVSQVSAEEACESQNPKFVKVHNLIGIMNYERRA